MHLVVEVVDVQGTAAAETKAIGGSWGLELVLGEAGGAVGGGVRRLARVVVLPTSANACAPCETCRLSFRLMAWSLRHVWKQSLRLYIATVPSPVSGYFLCARYLMIPFLFTGGVWNSIEVIKFHL